MATQVQNRRGTTAEHTTFTGANGELTVDTTKRTLVVHDGATAGGRPLLREDQSNLPTSAPTTGIYNASGSLAISTNGTGRLFVDASGNVSVGATGAESLLTVRGTNARILVRDEGTPIRAQFDIDSTNSLVRVGSRSYHPFVFTVQDTERMRITAAGLVGVGTSSPVARLETISTATVNGVANCTFRSSDNASSSFYIGHGAGGIANLVSDSPIGFGYNNGGTYVERMRLDVSGRLGVGSTSDPGGIGSRLWIDTTGDTYFTANTTGSGNLTGLHFRNSNGNGEARILNNTGGALTFYRSPGNEAVRIDSSGRLLVGTSSDSGGALLQVNGDRIRVGTAKTPASATATGTAGEICWDASYVYVCTATNTWKRSALSTW